MLILCRVQIPIDINTRYMPHYHSSTLPLIFLSSLPFSLPSSVSREILRKYKIEICLAIISPRSQCPCFLCSFCVCPLLLFCSVCFAVFMSEFFFSYASSPGSIPFMTCVAEDYNLVTSFLLLLLLIPVCV